MDKFTLSQLITALKLIREERDCEDCGICANVDSLMSVDSNQYDEFLDLMISWSKFSGQEIYPVNGQDSYHRAKTNGTLWDKSTNEGRLRFELLDYLIDTVETMYNETNP